jgi:hypothetical protein
MGTKTALFRQKKRPSSSQNKVVTFVKIFLSLSSSFLISSYINRTTAKEKGEKGGEKGMKKNEMEKKGKR